MIEKNKLLTYHKYITDDLLTPKDISIIFDLDLDELRTLLMDNGLSTYVKLSKEERNSMKLKHINNRVDWLKNNPTVLNEYKTGLINKDEFLKKVVTSQTNLKPILTKLLGNEYGNFMSKVTNSQARVNKDKDVSYGFPEGSKERELFEKTMIEKYGSKSGFDKNSPIRQKFVKERIEKTGVPHFAMVDSYTEIVESLKNNDLLMKTFDFKFDDDMVNNRRQVYEVTNKGYEFMYKKFIDVNGYLDKYPDGELIKFFKLKKKVNKTKAQELESLGLIYFDKKSSKLSKHEKPIMELLDSMGLRYKINDRTILQDDDNKGHGLEIDFLLLDYPIGFEINPSHSHNSNKYRIPNYKKYGRIYKTKDKLYHFNKFRKASEKGITLIQLYDWNLTKNFINTHLKCFIEQLTNQPSIKTIYARDVTIIEAKSNEDKKEIRDFINKNHRSGVVNAKYYYGAYYNNELVGAASFKSVFNKPKSIELKRLCFKLNHRIIGLTSKFTKTFLRDYVNFDEIISFSDNDFGNGLSYEKSGYRFDGYSYPTKLFVSTTNPNDTYSWQINTSWGATKGGVVNKDLDLKGKSLDDYDSIQEYIERELSHKEGQSKGYDVIYTSGSKRWVYERKE